VRKPLNAMPSFIYLASQSPRRAQLLDQLGVLHRLLLAGEDEDVEALEQVLPREKPTDYVQRVTLAKLQAAQVRLTQRGLPPAPVLCADTTVAVGASILGKPQDAAQARSMLQRLSGRTHRVCTAVAVSLPSLKSKPRVLHALSVSRVQVAVLSLRDIDAYIATQEPFGKAGAYAIQGRFAAWVQAIHGSHSGIMGLPLFETAQLLAHIPSVLSQPSKITKT
jgi:septum formation protein